MFRVEVIVVFFAVCSALNSKLDSEWQAYKKTYRKQYDGEVEMLRRTIWEKNVGYIQNHNLEADRGLYTFWLGMNQYGDMTNEEFRSKMNGYRQGNVTKSSRSTFIPPSNLPGLPSSVDWRDEGLVTPIKDQGQCGGCWSFSSTGSLEGQTKKKTGNLPSLSEQNLMDCSTTQGNKGCNGGRMDLAFIYIAENDGVDTESSYPYEAAMGPCRFNPANVGATCVGFAYVTSGSEADLETAVATVGPISVAIDASLLSFQLYRSGVYSDPQCSSMYMDHAVLAVGYGSDQGQDYWLVKNSWGESWGDAGYIKMSRNNDNNCGIATDACFPLV